MAFRITQIKLDPNNAADTKTLGRQVASWAKWDGETIFEAFSAALIDANYHAEAEQLRKIWEHSS